MRLNVLALKFNYGQLYFISPAGLSVISFGICLLAFLFPPGFYEYVIREPDRMFLNFNMLSFYTLSLSSLLLGYLSSKSVVKVKPSIAKASHIFLPLLLFCVVVSFYVLYVEFTCNEYLLLNIFELKGSFVKENFTVPSGVNALAFVLMGFAWWSVWQWSRVGRLFLKFLAVVLVLAVTSTGVIKLSRGEVVPLLFGVIVSILGVRASKNLDSNKKTKKMHFVAMLILLGTIFVVFSIARGSSGVMGLEHDIIGYTISSFNRLASVLDGSLVYPYAGKGIYVFNFLGYNNAINNLLHTRELFDWPDFNTYWLSEFGAVKRAGLNESLIWSTAPGYVFSDLGYVSFIYWYLIGILYRVAWVSFCNQKIFGMVVYPWLAFCLFFWFGMNYIVDTRLVALILCVLISVLCDKTIYIVRALYKSGVAKSGTTY